MFLVPNTKSWYPWACLVGNDFPPILGGLSVTAALVRDNVPGVQDEWQSLACSFEASPEMQSNKVKEQVILMIAQEEQTFKG